MGLVCLCTRMRTPQNTILRGPLKRDGFSPRAEPPPAFFNAISRVRDGYSSRFTRCALRAPGASLIFADLIAVVAADSDLTSLQQEKLLKGGDPATPSGTATLLRLHPPHRALLRRLRPSRVRPATSGAPDSGDVTGGECKARERIQRCVLTSVY
jgi:hypothetical protein